jgi:hypothetical protein
MPKNIENTLKCIYVKNLYFNMDMDYVLIVNKSKIIWN